MFHILRLPRYLQQLQDTHALPDMFGAYPVGLAGELNLFQSFMSEAPDHSLSVNCLVYSVN